MTNVGDDLVGRSLEYKSQRDQLLLVCKLLLCVYYGHWGPLGESDLARYAEMLLERADGRKFDPRQFILDEGHRIQQDR